MAHSGAVARARAGIARHDWREALRSFRDAAASVPLGADDLAALAWAHAWTGGLARGIQTWEQGFAAYSAEARWEAVAVAAFGVASWHTDEGSHAMAAGWRRSLERPAADHASSRVQGDAVLVRAWDTHRRHDLAEGEACGARAAARAVRCADRALWACATTRSWRGLTRYRSRTRRGVREE